MHIEEILYHCKKLFSLIDEENSLVENTFGGDIKEIYKKTLQKEKDYLKKELQKSKI